MLSLERLRRVQNVVNLRSKDITYQAIDWFRQ